MNIHDETLYDCAIIGGGVAGLALATVLAQAGQQVVLLEKEAYPYHKVCGEYISTESIPFLESLGLALDVPHMPIMTHLLLSSPKGATVVRPLQVGGVGRSRYALDDALHRCAMAAGARLRTRTKAHSVHWQDGQFRIAIDGGSILARTAVGAYGKNSKIDLQLQRSVKAQKDSSLFVGVKHHLQADFFDPSTVQIHNFEGGYCGLSAIEAGKTNMSYICRASVLKAQGSIAALERNILSRNPHLRRFFAEATFLYAKPLTISHLHFEIKSPVSGHLLMLGDAAGNIAPLSGNGMSMALQSAKIAATCLLHHLQGPSTLTELENAYAQAYRRAFARRIAIARYIHHLLGRKHLTEWGFGMLKIAPGMVDWLSRQIHGQVY